MYISTSEGTALEAWVRRAKRWSQGRYGLFIRRILKKGYMREDEWAYLQQRTDCASASPVVA